MAVGSRFNDPETQAAIAAQTETTPVTPKTEDQIKTDQDAASQDPSTNPATETDATLDMTPAVKTDPATAQDDTTTPTSAVPGAKATEITADTLKDAGYDEQTLIKQVRDNGGVVPEDLKVKLNEKFEASVVEAKVKEVESVFAQSIDMNTYIYESLANGDAVKGKDNFSTLSAWCVDNMPQSELAAINHLLQSGNKDVVRRGLTQAVTAWKKGQEKHMMSGDPIPTNQSTPAAEFKPLSRDEFRILMATDKYQSDPEYAATVNARRQKTIEEQGGRGFLTPEYGANRPPIY